MVDCILVCPQHLYNKYSEIRNEGQDVEAQMECMRQREHLERTVASLKRQVYKGTPGKLDVSKIMHVSATVLTSKVQAEYSHRQVGNCTHNE
jgi:hypothetical protein